MMDELRKINGQHEADVFYCALSALANVKADYVNFILPNQIPKFTWEKDAQTNMEPQPYLTVRRDPVGWWKMEDGSRHAVLEVKCGREVAMLIIPDLERILVKTPTKAE